MKPPCDVCGEPSTTSDGMIRAYLCDNPECCDAAWDDPPRNALARSGAGSAAYLDSDDTDLKDN